MMQLMHIRDHFPDALSNDNISFTYQSVAREKIPSRVLTDIRHYLQHLMHEPDQYSTQT